MFEDGLVSSIKTKVCATLVAAACFFTSAETSNATFKITDEITRNSSLLTYEAYRLTGDKDACTSSGKLIYATDQDIFDTVSIPSIISKETTEPTGGAGASVAVTATQWGVVAGMVAFGGGIGAIAAAIYVGVSWAIMADVCTNTYVVMAHEYFNRDAGLTCTQQSDGTVEWTEAGALTSTDIPYYYHCNPYYDPISNSELDTTSATDAAMIGLVYGYAGSASTYCSGDMRTYGDQAETLAIVGKIYLESANKMWAWNSYELCGVPDDDREGDFLGPGKDAMINIHDVDYMGFYHQDDDTGKIYLCAGAIYTLIPVVPACGSIAPPSEDDVIDEFLKAYVSGTRCEYMLGSRVDLKSLGISLADTDESGNTRTSVKKFLNSDMHFTSTVVGCIQDMLQKIFIKTDTTGGIFNAKPFFQQVQERLKQIVMTVLVLYAVLTGIKIMSSAEPPKKGEWMMMVIKFALVVYFAIGNAFYETTPSGEVKGLYPQLLNATSELAGIFLEAQNANELLGFCSYKYQGRNLLGERLYTGNVQSPPTIEVDGTVADDTTTAQATIGQTGVKLTVWDLVDCKLINYLNFGSCDYTVSGMVVAWLVSAAFWFSGTGFLLAIVALIYCFLILLVVFRYAHIFIMTMIVITVLIFLAPIFVPFILFDFTKGIFDKWLKTILGYLIYPALLFAFLALMLATIDSIYYGNLDTTTQTTAGGPVNIATACQDISSVYCVTIGALGSTTSLDACDSSLGSVAETVVTTTDVDYVGEMNTLTDSYSTDILLPLVEIMLFAFLFYLFMDSVSGFMSVLLGVQDIGRSAKGSFNVFNAIGSIAGAAKGGAGAAKGAGKSIASKMKK